MTDSLTFAKAVLVAQPFSSLIGTEIAAFSAEHTELILPITDKIKQQNGFVHGGVISYMADNALTFAGGAALGPDVVTSEMKINYIRPAIGARVIARASVVHAGRRQAVCRCDIFVEQDGGEVLCAAAQGTISKSSA
jgi:uncharacterized protein (TIGR00369 family)